MTARQHPRPSTVLVKACLNGTRTRAEHEAVPLSARDLAIESERAVAAGAGALHVHPRTPDGSESLDPGVCGAAISAIRAVCPGVPVGLSTGVWIESTPDRRLSCITRWTILPDFVSVNVSEPGTQDLCEYLLVRGIGIEAGVWSAADAETFVKSGLAGRCLRVLIEPTDPLPNDALSTAAAVNAVLDRHGITLPRLLHGIEQAAWAVLETALRQGYDIRIGFEDTLDLPDGKRAQSNADLIAAAVHLALRHGYRPRSTPSKFSGTLPADVRPVPPGL